MTLGCSLHVSHKFSICLTHKVTSGKQHIIGVDGVDDVETYNNYDKMLLFTDFPKKISVVEKNLPKDIAMGTKRCQEKGRYSGLASC